MKRPNKVAPEHGESSGCLIPKLNNEPDFANGIPRVRLDPRSSQRTKAAAGLSRKAMWGKKLLHAFPGDPT